MEPRASYLIPDRPPLQREIRSAVDEAIYDVLGGPSAAADALASSRGAVGNLVANQPIKDRATALKIEEATAKAKRRVPAAELMALVPWGSLRHATTDDDGPDKGRNRPSDAARSLAAVPRSTAKSALDQPHARASTFRVRARGRGRSRPSWSRAATLQAVGF